MTITSDDGNRLSLGNQITSDKSDAREYQGYGFSNLGASTLSMSPLFQKLGSYLGRLSVDDQSRTLEDLYSQLALPEQYLAENRYHRYSRHKSKKYRRFIKQSLKWTTRVTIGIFAAIGLLFTAVFFGMRMGLFNVQGSISQRDSFYGSLPKISTAAATAATALGTTPTTTHLAMTTIQTCSQTPANCAWISSPQWATVSAGLIKDSDVINQAAEETGVSSRMIIAAVAPEQLRLFTSEREYYEEFFQPLKVLGSMTSFSLGVAGIKQQTANQIEANTSNVSSPFYPGPGYSDLITYPNGVYSSSLQYDRLTSNNHYYDYLYVGLFIKEIEAQWFKAGYDINQRPDVITTLYNIGFQHSTPNANPEAGGTTITVANQSYSFGQLGTLIYTSNQLTSQFPATSN